MPEVYPVEQKALAWFDSLSELQRAAITTAYNLEAMTTAEELEELYACEDQAMSLKIKHKKKYQNLTAYIVTRWSRLHGYGLVA